jgi:hypothetical protein
MLMTEVSAVVVMEGIPSETSSNDARVQWLEEEEKTETVTTIDEDISQKINGPSGGYAVAQKPFAFQERSSFIHKSKCIQSSWILISKNPRYIQFCCLKLDF